MFPAIHLGKLLLWPRSDWCLEVDLPLFTVLPTGEEQGIENEGEHHHLNRHGARWRRGRINLPSVGPEAANEASWSMGKRWANRNAEEKKILKRSG